MVKNKDKVIKNSEKKSELINLLSKCNLDEDVNLEDKDAMFNLLLKLLSELLSVKQSLEVRNKGDTQKGAGGSGGGVGDEVFPGAGEEGGEWTENTNKSTNSKFKILSSRVRKNEDHTDFIHQRSVKGVVIVCSPNNPEKNLKTLIKDPSELQDETYLGQMIRLIKQYYDVDIKPSDVINCHPTKQPGCAMIKFCNRNIGSAFSRLSQAIKTGGVKRLPKKGGAEEKEGAVTETVREGLDGEGKTSDEEAKREGATKGATEVKEVRGEKSKGSFHFQRPNFWLTFQMTTRRSALIKKLKELKKNREIFKFYSDENGEISFIKNVGGSKQKLTMDWTDPDNTKTFTVEELVKLIQNK